MTIHDDALSAFHAVYDQEFERSRNLLAIADTELLELRTGKAAFVAEVERLSSTCLLEARETQLHRPLR